MLKDRDTKTFLKSLKSNLFSNLLILLHLISTTLTILAKYKFLNQIFIRLRLLKIEKSNKFKKHYGRGEYINNIYRIYNKKSAIKK